MVFCTYCGQAFTRDEHLERHILTHTNIKPYKCPECHMSFSRRDLLQRHFSVHGRDKNNEVGVPLMGMIPRTAGRTPIACKNCAKTKTKCDKKTPCSRCTSKNLVCELRPTRRASKSAHRLSNSPPEADARDRSGSVSSMPETQEPSGQNTPSPPGQETQQDGLAPIRRYRQQSQRTSISQASLQRPPQSPSLNHSPDQSLSLPVRPVSTPTFEDTPSHLSLSQQTLPYFDPSSHTFLSQAPSMVSPFAAPMNGISEFANAAPMSHYNDFFQAADNSLGTQFMDGPWDSNPMGVGFEQMRINTDRIDPVLSVAGSIDWSRFLSQDGCVGMMTTMSPSHGSGPVQSPFQTPRTEQSFSDLQIGSSATVYPGNRGPSVVDAGIHDLDEIVEAQDSWNVFRCTPSIPHIPCPKTARLILERLELSLKNHESWRNWFPLWQESDFQQGGQILVKRIQESTRDTLLAITQGFLHKALDIHRTSSNSSGSGDSPGSHSSGSNFLLLPPARVLELFLVSYTNSCERYYPCSARGILNLNLLMKNYHEQASSSLLILLMIAQGAANIGSIEARWLAGGFTEACRISLFDMIEKDIDMAGNPIVQRAALLFIVQAAWSGDKWQMDIAEGQRFTYLSMLRNTRTFEYRPVVASQVNGGSSSETLWTDWLKEESQSRLIYSWIMVDQELSLFQDTPPFVREDEYDSPMPDCESLWQAQNDALWSATFNEVHAFSDGYSSVGSGVRPLSLRDVFFDHFIKDELIMQDGQEIRLTPMQLRLLLHPLQSRLCGGSSIHNETASTMSRLQELQALLGRWFNLAQRYMERNPTCPMMQATLVMYNLIRMNSVTDFRGIERLARGEGIDGSYQQMLAERQKCMQNPQEAVVYAGQVLRLVREMSRGTRPPWWAGAVYRATLVMWAESLTHRLPSPSCPVQIQRSGLMVSVDRLLPNHALIDGYISCGRGVPTMTKRDGTPIMLDNGSVVLSHCIEVIDEGVATRLSDGIRNKLEKLARAQQFPCLF